MMVPGVSGGSMAMVLGIYDRLISSVSSFFKDWKGNALYLIQFGLPALLGIVICASPISSVIDRFPVVSMFFFIGLVFGSLPMLYKTAKIERLNWKYALSFIIGVAVVVAMAYLPPMGGDDVSLEMSVATFLLQIVTGIVVAVGFILPGISTSYLLLLLGTYDYVMLAIAQLNIIALIPFVLGFILGVILLTRILEICMQRFPQLTYMMIMGFLIGSLYTVYPGTPSGWEIPLSILMFAIGFTIIYLFPGRRHPLRRLDRDCSADDSVIEKCIQDSHVLRICMNTDSLPYIVPLCFGYEKVDGRRIFYFHKNRRGLLYELIEKDPRCSFELEGEHSLFMDEVKRTCNMDYASIIGYGTISLVEGDEERKRTIDLLMDHYDRGDFGYDERLMSAILVFRLEVDSLTCKATRGWKEKMGC